MKRFSIITLGCKVNQYDGAAMAATLVGLGLQADDAAPADLLVVNTCCVTATAMRKSRQAIRQALRSSPGAAVLVAGCYGDYDAPMISGVLASMGVAPDRAFVAGHHHDLAQILRQVVRSLDRGDPAASLAAGGNSVETAGSRRPGGYVGGNFQSEHPSIQGCRTTAFDPASIKQRRLAAVKENVPGTRFLSPVQCFEGRQRAFVKIQDGCDAFCSYCIVPFLRCNVRSRDSKEILRECRRLVEGGHKEIVLAGVFLGAFGRHSAIRRTWQGEPSRLGDLVRRVAEIPGLWRVRLSSLEPLDLTEELLVTLRELPNFAAHLHLPLQSGSSEILRAMNRQYGIAEYLRAVRLAREVFDRPAITTDIIVGFPGESEGDFRATLDVARAAGFAKIHAFPFSPIEPTAAWRRRAEAPPAPVVKQRMAALAELEAELAVEYRRQFLGETVEALVEGPSPRQPRTLEALTDRYLTVRLPARPQMCRELPGRVVHVRLKKVTSFGLTGELEDIGA